jgi:hypothetical protein
MSDPYTGARAPDATPRADVPTPAVTEAYPASTYVETTYPATETYASTEAYPATGTDDDGGKQAAVKQAAGQSAQAAGQAASEVKDTAKEQAQRVAGEAKAQARNVASDVRGKVSDQAKAQNDKLVGSIRQMADHLNEMSADRESSPAVQVVSRVADGGRQVADYLDRNGPEGVLREVSDFARRRPGAFLVTALAAGFVVGRLGKGVLKADDTAGKPASDSFVSDSDRTASNGGYTTPAAYTAGTGTGYSTGTEYASTGTGAPVVVEEEFVVDTAPGYPGTVR